MTTGIIITLIVGAVLIILTSFSHENENIFITNIAIMGVIYVIILGLHVDNNLTQPKFNIDDKVQLPDTTWGKIDSVAYKIEGNWYNQEVLKD